MFRWLKKMFGKRSGMDICVHVCGVLNVRQISQETEERKPRPQNGNSAYFTSEGIKTVGPEGPDLPIILDGIGDVPLPEADFGREES